MIETEEMMARLSGVNTESTLSITGVVRERSSKNPNLPTGEIEVVPTDKMCIRDRSMISLRSASS